MPNSLGETGIRKPCVLNRERLGEDEIVIEFIDFRYRFAVDSLRPHLYCAAIIKKDMSYPQFIEITDKEKLLPEMENYLRNKSAAHDLYQTIWEPMKPYLDNIKKVHLSPSGILHEIAFEALRDENGQYLQDSYDFHYYSAIRDILDEKPSENDTINKKNIALVGHIIYEASEEQQLKEEEINYKFDADDLDLVSRNTRGVFHALPGPGTLSEVKMIDSIARRSTKFTTTLLTLDKHTEERVKSLSGNQAPYIWHFATHGVFLPRRNIPQVHHINHQGLEARLSFSDNPLQRSLIALCGANHRWEKNEPNIYGDKDDGILTALEVTSLDLDNTHLVVLSACKSGLGDLDNTEGVFGLQRAFKIAGVEYVIASLWNVDDAATKDLMILFYHNLLEKEMDTATALREAKKTMREEGYQPKNWAGFILIE